MITVGFKYVSTDPSFTDFNAINVIPDYDVQNTKYLDINNTKRKIVDVAHKTWEIIFARLTQTQQDWLIELKKKEAPQMYYNSTTYNIEIEEMNLRHIGGKLTVSNTVKES